MVATHAETHGQEGARSVAADAPVLIGLSLLVCAYLIAYWPTLSWVAGEWSASAGVMSHGYLVALISVVLFVRAVPAFLSVERAPAWILLPVLLGLSVVWLLGRVATVVAVETILLPALLLLALAMAFGVTAARKLAFPVLYLYLAMPVVEHLQYVFQQITVVVVGGLLRIADIPANMEGNFVLLPSGAFEIASGCSGLNFIVAGLSLSILYAYLYYSSPSKFLKLTGITLLLAMLGNWIRVFAIVLIGYFTEMQSPLVGDHLSFGWIIFSILMIPAFFVARRLEAGEASPSQTADVPRRAGNVPAAGWGGIVAATAVMVIGPVWAATVVTASEEAPELRLADGAGVWAGPYDTTWEWAPHFTGPDAERTAEYRSGNSFVLAYVNVYLAQEQDRELIYFSNRIGGDWQVIENRDSSLADTAGFRQVAAQNYAGQWLIWYRYQIGETFETRDTRAKLSQALTTLSGEPRAGVVAFAALCDEGCDAASARLAAFVEDVGNAIRAVPTGSEGST